MLTLLNREWDVATRQPAFTIAVWVHATLVAAFVVAWGDGRGVPLLPVPEFYSQARLIQAGVLALLFPWAAARCTSSERGDDLVWLSALTAIRPSYLSTARAAALLGALVVIGLSGLPAVLFASQMSDIPLSRVLVDETDVMALAVIATATVLLWQQLCPGRLLGWLAAASCTLLAAALASVATGDVMKRGFTLGTAGFAILLWVTVRSDTRLRYLSEVRSL